MELKVAQLDRITAGNIVTTIHWTATKIDGEISASSYGTVGLEAGSTVIPFADLTEEIVKTWLAEKLDLVEIENSLDAQIDSQKAPTVASGLPWAQQ
jgi:hypothetical protein